MKFVVFLMLACLVSAIYADGHVHHAIEAVLRTNACGGAATPAITPTQLTTPPPQAESAKRSVLDTQVMTFEADGDCYPYLNFLYSTMSFNGTWISGNFGYGGCYERSEMTNYVSLDQAATSGTTICQDLTIYHNGYTFLSAQITPVTHNMTPPSSASTIVPSVLVLIAVLGALLVMF